MKSINQLLLLALALLYFSCSPSAKEAPLAEETPAMEEKVTQEKPQSTETDGGYVVTAAYEDATVYAGKIDYRFSIVVSTGTGAFEDDVEIPMPDNMLEEDTGDLPGANPELIGRLCKIYYGPDHKVLKVEMTDKNWYE